jgi:GNAT superfamily N-acetyltransferase
MRIRKAEGKDVPQVVELWKEMMDFHRGRDSFFSRADKGHEEFARYVLENLELPDRVVLIADDGGTVVGFCSAVVMEYPPVFRIKRFGFIQDMAVTDARRGEGIGRELCKNIMDWFAINGVSRVELHAATTNEVSTAFWESMGFKPFLYKMAKTIE